MPEWRLAGALALMLTLVATGVSPGQSWPKPPLGVPLLLATLRVRGYVLYFRHTDIDWSQKDTRGMSLDERAAQRNLSERGRANGRIIGEEIRGLGIPIG